MVTFANEFRKRNPTLFKDLYNLGKDASSSWGDARKLFRDAEEDDVFHMTADANYRYHFISIKKHDELKKQYYKKLDERFEAEARHEAEARQC